MYIIMCRNKIGQVYELSGPHPRKRAHSIMSAVGWAAIQRRTYCELWLTSILDI